MEHWLRGSYQSRGTKRNLGVCLPWILLLPPPFTGAWSSFPGLQPAGSDPQPSGFPCRCPVIVPGYAAATAAATAVLAEAPPLLAEGGTRLNGDGSGLIIGVNITILGWVLLSACDLVWA